MKVTSSIFINILYLDLIGFTKEIGIWSKISRIFSFLTKYLYNIAYIGLTKGLHTARHRVLVIIMGYGVIFQFTISRKCRII